MTALEPPAVAAPTARPSVLTLLKARSADLRQLVWLLAGLILLVLLPAEGDRVRAAAGEAVALAHGYAREHVVLCLVPALFIAGAMGVFVRQSAVMRFLGPRASKPVAYGVASVSGTILAVCSCTVLPLFAGIWRLGAGLGPAVAFLYSGPAINVLAIILTARVLGLELGIARAAGAVAFSVVIGLLMAWIFRSDARPSSSAADVQDGDEAEPVAPGVALLGVLMAILIFANWPGGAMAGGFFAAVAAIKWWLVAACAAGMAALLAGAYGVNWRWLLAAGGATAAAAAAVPGTPEVPFVVATAGLTLCLLAGGERAARWVESTWGFARQIVPLLLAGVLIAGFLLGRPGHEGLVPSAWVESSVGGSGLGATFFAAVAGAFMYFATLTEVPILQGLVGSGMGKGPALALLLAGPALSLPSMLALRQVLGTRKTAAYVALVIVMATATGWAYGLLF